MARIRSAKRVFARLGCSLLFAAGPLGLPRAAAQEVEGLRTGIAADETLADAQQPDGFRSTYVPRSSGAPTDEEADAGGAFAIPDETTSASADIPLPRARPGTAPPLSREAGDDAAETEPETTGTVRVESVERAAAAEPVGQRIEAIEAGYREPEDDPYAPLGLRLGTFIVRPSLEQGIAWTSNASSSPGGSQAVLSETTLRLDAISDWSRHSAAVSAYGTFRKSLSGEEVSDPEGGIDAELIFDLAGGFRAIAAAGYALRPESATSPVDLPATTSRPLRQTLTGSLGLEKDVGLLRFGLTGRVERQQFGDAELEGGGTFSQRDRNFVLTTAVLRTGYELSPALTPFVEGEIGRRIYDVSLDASGYDRSASRLGARAGVEIDLGEKLFGEVSAGWIREDLDDARLAPISAATVNADLFWSPVRGTLVGLHAATMIESATTPGESGSVLHNGRLTLERQMRANLTGTAQLGAEWRDYAGSAEYDLTLCAETGLTYWFNRYAGLTGRLRHETVKSDDPGRESETNSVFLGIKLQR